MEGSNSSRGAVHRIDVKSAKEADELPPKNAVNTGFTYPSYRDRVSWIAVVYKAIPDAVGLAGVKYAFNSAEVRWRRLLWIFLMLAGTGFCCYQVVERSIFYASNPKSVDVSIDEVSSIVFPTVAICNYNRYSESKVNGTRFGDFVKDAFLNPTTVNYSQYYNYLNSVTYNDLLFNYSHSLEKSIKEVKWNRLPVYPATANFTLKMTDWGPCFMFNDADNGLDPVVTTTPGRATSGLEVTIDVQQEDYFYDPWTVFSAGMHVAVYPHGTQPFIEDFGFSIAPGTSTLVGLDLEQNVFLAHPWGKCENKTLQHFDYYGPLECKLECAGEFIASRCGCKVLSMPANAPFCTAWEFYTCVDPALIDFVLNVTCDCPQPCSTRGYISSSSQTTFPASFYAPSLAATFNETQDYFRENICRLTIYFRELNVVTRTQQRDYTFFGLLCDIGGSLGLWLGGSILTFFEIVDLFGHATYVYTRRGPQK